MSKGKMTKNKPESSFLEKLSTGFSNYMDSEHGQDMVLGTVDLALGDGPKPNAAGYMSTGSLASSVTKGALVGGMTGGVAGAMVGTGINLATHFLQKDQIEKQNEALYDMKKMELAAKHNQEDLGAMERYRHQKTRATKKMGQDLSRILLT